MYNHKVSKELPNIYQIFFNVTLTQVHWQTHFNFAFLLKLLFYILYVSFMYDEIYDYYKH